MAEKNPKTLTYTQEQNGSPFFFLWLDNAYGRHCQERLLRKAAAIRTDEFYRLCRVYVLQMRLIRLFTIKTLVIFLKYIFELIFYTNQPAFSALH